MARLLYVTDLLHAQQATGFALTFGGYILGHSHKGRMFPRSAHGTFASILLVPIAGQFILGIYLKLHIMKSRLGPMRLSPMVSLENYTQYLAGRRCCSALSHFEVIVRVTIWVRRFSSVRVEPPPLSKLQLHQEQCIAHYTMGSGFIAYAIIMAIILLVGESWVRRSGRSPEWWDSW